MNTTPSSTPRISSTSTSDGIAVTRTPRHGNWPMPDEQVDATGQAGNSNKRALVLAGGGAAGNAWELGLIAGLSDAGVDVTDADLIIGTSAGSTVAAQITSGTRPADVYAAILAEVHQPRTGGAGVGQGTRSERLGPELPGVVERDHRLCDGCVRHAPQDGRRGARDGCLRNGSSQTRWRDIVAARLPSQQWPQQPVLIAAVDAHTGEPVVFDRHSGVDLVDAVAASTLGDDALPHRREPVHQRRLPTQRERRPGSWIRAGAGAVTVRRQVAHAAGVGHGSRNPSRRTARRRQQRRDGLPGQRRG